MAPDCWFEGAARRSSSRWWWRHLAITILLVLFAIVLVKVGILQRNRVHEIGASQAGEFGPQFVLALRRFHARHDVRSLLVFTAGSLLFLFLRQFGAEPRHARTLIADRREEQRAKGQRHRGLLLLLGTGEFRAQILGGLQQFARRRCCCFFVLLFEHFLDLGFRPGNHEFRQRAILQAAFEVPRHFFRHLVHQGKLLQALDGRQRFWLLLIATAAALAGGGSCHGAAFVWGIQDDGAMCNGNQARRKSGWRDAMMDGWWCFEPQRGFEERPGIRLPLPVVIAVRE